MNSVAGRAACIQQAKEAKTNGTALEPPGNTTESAASDSAAGAASSRAASPAPSQTNGKATSPAASDVDELESDGDSAPQPKGKAAGKKKKGKGGNVTSPEPAKPEVKDEAWHDAKLKELVEEEAMLDLEFRRHQSVVRVRPLGKDRFFCQYWVSIRGKSARHDLLMCVCVCAVSRWCWINVRGV